MNCREKTRKNVLVFSYSEMVYMAQILFRGSLWSSYPYDHQYRDCWWPGGLNSQGIGSHGNDIIFRQYTGTGSTISRFVKATREELVSDNNLIVMTFCRCGHKFIATYPDNKLHGAKMGPTWVLPAPDGPHLAPWTLLSGYIHDAVVFSWNTFCVEFLEHSGISRRVGNDPHRNL